MDRTLYLSTAELTERGWSKSMIPRFLGEHDEEKRNPFYRSASPMKLYLRERAQSVEGSDDFKKAREKAAIRSEAATLRAEQAAQTLTQSVLSKVKLHKMDYEQLRAKALKHKAQRDRDLGEMDWCNVHQAEEEHIQRWMVNYARHQLSNYDAVRIHYAGKVGVHQAAEAVRDAVLTKIAQTWPELGEAAYKAKRSFEG